MNIRIEIELNVFRDLAFPASKQDFCFYLSTLIASSYDLNWNEAHHLISSAAHAMTDFEIFSERWAGVP
jgi:hypothetical protein